MCRLASVRCAVAFLWHFDWQDDTHQSIDDGLQYRFITSMNCGKISGIGKARNSLSALSWKIVNVVE